MLWNALLFGLCFLESCLWFPIRYGSLLSLWELIFSVWLLPFIFGVSDLWDESMARVVLQLWALQYWRCPQHLGKHQLTTAKVLEQILLPRQAGRAELFPKDWMLPAFWMSVKSNIKGPSVLYPQSIKNTALHPPCYSLDLLKKVPADIFLLI